MGEVLKLCGIGFLGLCASLILKERYKLSGTVATIATFLIIFSYNVGNGVKGAVETVGSFVSGSSFSEYAGVMMKALGIAYITSSTEQICKEAGEGTIGSAVAFSGKVQLVLLSLPLVSSLLDIASSLV